MRESLIYQGRADPVFAEQHGARDGWQYQPQIPLKRAFPAAIFVTTIAFVAQPPPAVVAASVAGWQPASPFFAYGDVANTGAALDRQPPPVSSWMPASPFFVLGDQTPNHGQPSPPPPYTGNLSDWLPKVSDVARRPRAPIFAEGVRAVFVPAPPPPSEGAALFPEWYRDNQIPTYERPTISVDMGGRASFAEIPRLPGWYIQPLDLVRLRPVTRTEFATRGKLDQPAPPPPVTMDMWFCQPLDMARLRRPTRTDQEHRGNLNQPFVPEVLTMGWFVQYPVAQMPRRVPSYLFAGSFHMNQGGPPQVTSLGLPIILMSF